MNDKLNNKTVIITGGAKGLGLACSNAFYRAGANVVMTGRSASAGQAAVQDLGDRARFFQQDVSSNEDWLRVMSSTEDAFGRVDVVVANAGINTPMPIVSEPLEAFRTVSNINLKGAFLAVKYGAEALRKHGDGGSIILMASIMGRKSAPAHANYSSSKAGMRLLAKAAALELGAEGIRVNAVLPGLSHSDMTSAFDEATIAPMLIPMGRFGKAEEIAETVLFAASDRSKFMTGAELVIDGGMLAQ